VTRPTRAVVDLGAIARNYRRLEARAGGRSLIPVLKADAYGHGALPVARRLEREGAARFAVAIAEEALPLRRGGIAGEILLLNHADPSDVPLHRAFGLTPTLHGMEQARAFADAARGLRDPLRVHVKVDSGMGRLGFSPSELGDLVALMRRSRGLRVAGTFTTFASADEPSSPVTALQIGRFRAAVAALLDAGIAPGLVHLDNSGSLIAGAASGGDAVRPGIALYGIAPAPDSSFDLEPAMRLETRVIAMREVPSGTPLGYGGRFVTGRPSRIAIVPIGYHDGLRRSFFGRVSMVVRGRRAPLVGAVSMDLTLLDATESGASPGDPAICLGEEVGLRITAWDLARAADTIPYEILCGISARVPRAYAG